MKKIENFRTPFPHSGGISSVILYFQQLVQEIKKRQNAWYSNVLALYPGRDLNPHDRNGHRILSPDHLSEIPVKSQLHPLLFDAKNDISAPYFPPFRTLKNFCFFQFLQIINQSF